jgi:Fe-S-cluster containining protein
MSDDKESLNKESDQEVNDVNQDEQPPAEEVKTEEKKPEKKKYVFNCTKCGQCCQKREFVPVSFNDLRKWTQSGMINSIFPHLKLRTFPTKIQEEVREVISMVLAGTETGCPLYDKENKLCNIYHAMPLECQAFPLGFNGQQYFIKDKTVPGLGYGTMSKEKLVDDRDNARLDYEAQIETQMLLPITYSLFMQNLIEQQQKIRDEMPEDKRKQLDDLLKGEEPKA